MLRLPQCSICLICVINVQFLYLILTVSMGSKPFRSQDKTESPQELPETASTTSKSSYSFLCGIPNKIDNVATRPVTMRLNDAVSIAVGNNSNTLNENRQSWPNRRLKCLRLCEGDNSVVPMCIQKQYFSICEAGNAEAMRFLMLEYPCHSLNFTQHYEVAVETGESCQTTMLTPLQLVCIHGHVYIAVMLLDRTSTNCNIVDPTYKMTALHFAVAMRNKLMVELLSRQANINVNISDYKGLTPLHIAIKLDSVSMIKTIFRTQKKTLDLAVLDAGGNSVCHLAVKLCALDTVDIILNFLLNDIEKLVCFRKFSGGLLGKDVKVFSWFNLGNFNLRYLQWMNHNTQIVFVDNILQVRCTYAGVIMSI